MSNSTCSPDADLLALVTNEPSGAVAEHLPGCPACRRRARFLLEEVMNLREVAKSLPLPTAVRAPRGHSPFR